MSKPLEDLGAAAAIDLDDLLYAVVGSNSRKISPQVLINLLLTSLGGFKDRIINGDGRVYQRSVTSLSDDTYGHDRHYALTQTGAVSASTVEVGAGGVGYMWRLTQSQASAQRFGYAQIIESKDVLDLRGLEVTLGGNLRYSNAAALRFAVLEWTGTADSVTSDIVNDWTNGTYAAGQFFNSTTLNVLAVGSLTPSASTVTPFSLKATIGASANNLIVFMWTEGAAAQNSTLDGQWALLPGDVTSDDVIFRPRPLAQEIALCQRYYEVIVDGDQQIIGAGGYYSASQCECTVEFKTGKRNTSYSLEMATGAYYQFVSGASGSDGITSLTLNRPGTRRCLLFNNTEASGTGGDYGRATSYSTSARIAINNEL